MALIKSFDLSDVEYISLMSKYQYEEAIAKVPNIPIEQFDLWWLQDRISDDESYCVMPASGVVNIMTNSSELGIRPYFIFKEPFDTNIQPGSKIYVEDQMCTVISGFSALSDIIVDHQKRENASSAQVFTDSELYVYLNSEVFIRDIFTGLPF